MKKVSAAFFAIALVFATFTAFLAAAGEAGLLFEIGTLDRDTRDLLHGPGDYAKCTEDIVYVVGSSRPGTGWPYAHPGPTDPWGGSRPHAYTIVFTLAGKPAGDCRLLVDLADTHAGGPPVLRISANGAEVARHPTPRGSGDASIFGEPSKGRPHSFAAVIPAASLREGANEIVIENVSGSWVIYDRVALEAPAGTKLAPTPPMALIGIARGEPVLVDRGGKLLQIVAVEIRNIGGAFEGEVRVAGADPVKASFKAGATRVEASIPAVDAEKKVAVEIFSSDGKVLASKEATVRPVRKWTVYLLPHSHVDIGYTKVQTEVERDHWGYIESAIETSRKTAANPPGSQFKWNVEVLWAVDGYLRQATPEKRDRLVDAVKKGWLGLDALYGNELTALPRPEELVRLVECAGRLEKLCGVEIDSAMISDVPGYTWSIVPVLAAAGVKYWSIGPNGGDRIGHTLEAWADRPFRWVGQDGRSRVLCWIPDRGYWNAFGTGTDLPERLRALDEKGYPYDMVQVRYCLGDNAGPGFQLCDLVKDWNAKHAWPRLVIATTSEMMRELDRRYGAIIPEARGDFTPYWEDGAASSALETALNRAAAERLSAAEAAFALTAPAKYPADDFRAAWRAAVLYDEHTWGAHNSISEPDSELVRKQWAIKRAFAVEADGRSRALLDAALAPVRRAGDAVEAVRVVNPSSWARTDLVALPAGWKTPGGRVTGPGGTPVPSQRLESGELAFVARDVPPFGSRLFRLAAGEPLAAGEVVVRGARIRRGGLEVAIDPRTGSIGTLRAPGIQGNLVDRTGGLGLNEYLHVAGKDPKDARPAGPARVALGEMGPLVGSLIVEGPAPGCRSFVREIRVVDGLDRIDIVDRIDKEKVRSKEGVHIAFPFAVPGGAMRLDLGWSVIRPEADQMAGACRNWFTLQRWVDVSAEDRGVTLAIVDAPLVEVGGITAETPWIRALTPSATVLSYVMNNYWHTNYKADQEGPTTFRYSIRPHRGPHDPIEAARFGREASGPLLAVPADPAGPAETPPRLEVKSADAIVETLKPSEDGKALILRLFGASGRTGKAALEFADPKPTELWLSNLAEDRLEKVAGEVEVPAWGIVNLRAEMDGR